MNETESDSRFDGVSGCKTCDRGNVSNAVHGILQMVSCNEASPETLDEALELVEREARNQIER